MIEALQSIDTVTQVMRNIMTEADAALRGTLDRASEHCDINKMPSVCKKQSNWVNSSVQTAEVYYRQQYFFLYWIIPCLNWRRGSPSKIQPR